MRKLFIKNLREKITCFSSLNKKNDTSKYVKDLHVFRYIGDEVSSNVKVVGPSLGSTIEKVQIKRRVDIRDL